MLLFWLDIFVAEFDETIYLFYGEHLCTSVIFQM